MGAMVSQGRGTDVGKNLVAIRQKAGMTQVDLAKRLGWRDGSRISKIEHGLVKPDAVVWRRIARVLSAGEKSVVPVSVAQAESKQGNPDTPSWKYDSEKGVVVRKINDISFSVSVEEIRDPRTFSEWLKYLGSQEWATDEVIGSFVRLSTSLSSASTKHPS